MRNKSNIMECLKCEGQGWLDKEDYGNINCPDCEGKGYKFIPWSTVAMNMLRKLWTPIVIEEGVMVPRWYGVPGWVPFEVVSVPPELTKTYKWGKKAWPVYLSLMIAGWWWLKHFLKIGHALPPQCYRNSVFQVKSHCPKCGFDLYGFPPEL